ncbi:MAG TPA: PqiC family protein [Usitatibacter sp.]|nr:PqiC family protein [Usitatibacter sp.]
MKLWIAALVVLAGCGSTPREHYYTLASQPVALPPSTGNTMSIYVGPVSVPEAVDRSPMVLRTGPTQVDIDDMHRWAEPLKAAIPRAVADLLMRELGTPRVLAGRASSGAPADYRIAIDIQRFDSSLADGATLDAAWTITPAKGAPRTGRTFAQEASPTRDHAGVAAAHRTALEKLAKDLAAGLR